MSQELEDDQLRNPKEQRASDALFETLMEISRRCSALPDLDNRAADEILGYDAAGFTDASLTEEIPELRGEQFRPADFES